MQRDVKKKKGVTSESDERWGVTQPTITMLSHVLDWGIGVYIGTHTQFCTNLNLHFYHKNLIFQTWNIRRVRGTIAHPSALAGTKYPNTRAGNASLGTK